MTDRLIISNDVRDALGEGVVAALPGNDPEYRCTVCRVDGNFHRDDTSVAALVHSDGQRRIALGHASCMDSAVHNDVGPTDLSSRGPDDAVAVAALLSVKGKPRPYLFVHQRMAVTFMTEAGDSLAPAQSALLGQGWHLATQVEGKYPTARSWRLEIDERGRGRVVDGSGVVLIDRLPEDTPPQWFQMARRASAVTVLFGELGLGDGVEGERVLQVIHAACRRGRVVAAQVKVVRVERVAGPVPPGASPDPEQTEAETAKEVASLLQAALRTKADPNGQDPLNQAPEVIALPTRPTLTPFVIPEGREMLPALLVDLDDPDEERGARTLDEFVTAGLYRDRDLGNNQIPTGPQEWRHVTWPSQILIQAGRNNEGVATKVFFAPVTLPSDWLEALQRRHLNGVLLFVANLRGREHTPELLRDLSATGGLAVCGIPGMLAHDLN